MISKGFPMSTHSVENQVQLAPLQYWSVIRTRLS